MYRQSAGLVGLCGLSCALAFGADENVPPLPPVLPAPPVAGAPQELLPPIEKDQKGLLTLTVEMPPAPAATPEELSLGIKPYPGVIRKRLTWLYVPETYDPAVPGPLLLALHPRSRISAFSSSIQLVKPQFLDKWCKGTLETWKSLADEKGFLLVVPLGDPDPLTMGLSWHAGDRAAMFAALVQEVKKTHAFDEKRVYGAGSGDGAHALIASSVAKPELFAAVATCNPPLLDGEAQRQTREGVLLLPDTVDTWAAAGGIKVPLMILAGEAGKREFLSGRAPREMGPPQMPQMPRETNMEEEETSPPPPRHDKPRRYVDHESVLLPDHMEKMAAKLKTGEIPVSFSKCAGGHREPFPKDRAGEAWGWLAQFPPKPPEEKKPE